MDELKAMWKRDPIGSLGLTALVCLLFVIGAYLATRPSAVWITKEAFAQIEVGMTEKDVKRIIGGRAGNYNRRGMDAEAPMWVVSASYQRQWTGNDAVILVWFDEDGKVLAKKYAYLPELDLP